MKISRLSEAALVLATSLSPMNLAHGAEPYVFQPPIVRQAYAPSVNAVAASSAPTADAEPAADLDGKPAAGQAGSVDDLLNLDVEQLANAPVEVPVEFTPAALTETPRNIVPAATTRITREDIYNSGARNLNELLDIFVPNLEWIRHHWEQSNVGLRGIIPGDKYLLLVNGRIMNDKTHYGAASERELVQLNDIAYIDIIRGPGSSVLGPGAVSMVISIYTDTGETFQGTNAMVRAGAVDSYTSLEVKHGRKWECAEGGLLVYGGFGTRDGADQSDAPLVFGGTNPHFPPDWALPPTPVTTYQGYQAGDNVTNPIQNDNEAFQGQMPIKLFADLTYDEWEIWSRYTRSGSMFAMSPSAGFNYDNGYGSWVTQEQGESGTQQVSVQSKYETELTKDLKFLATLGWDRSEFVRTQFSGIQEAYGEQELNTKMLFTFDLDDNQFAIGGEFYNDWFGYRTHLIDSPPVTQRLGTNFEPWNAQTYSLLLEDQWQVNDELTAFIGGRWDKNIYTPWMYSPRLALIYAPDKYVTWKGLLNRSLRMNSAEELRAGWLATGDSTPPEILRSYELRRECTPYKDTFWALSAFYIDLDANQWDQLRSINTLTGNQTQWGMEAEIAVRNDCWTVMASHSYTTLITFTLTDPDASQFITAKPYGYSNQLANWSPHITKIFVHRQLDPKLSVDASLRYYWGYSGLKGLNEWRKVQETTSYAGMVPGWERTFRESVFLNIGGCYQYNEHVRFRLDGYNLLGIFEQDLNKRVYYAEHSFICDAPAVGLSGEVQF